MRSIFIFILFVLTAIVCLTSCGPRNSAEFKAKACFRNRKTLQLQASPFVEIIKVDAHYSVGDTISTGDGPFVLISKLPLLPSN